MFITSIEQLGGARDVIVVGAGAAGILIAAQLAEAGKRVLLLEAGDKVASSDTAFEDVSSVGRPFTGLERGRARGLGGTTNRWGGQIVALEPLVFEERPWLGESGWPIRATDLDDAHERTLDLLGMQRRLDDQAVWQRLRVAPPPPGEGLQLFLTHWLPEPNFARLFSTVLEHNTNLLVATGACVRSLGRSSEGSRIGVSVTMGEQCAYLDAEHVVLASGTVEIARLLMQPMAEHRLAPWADNRWVGRGFVDHIDCDAGTVTPLDQRRFHAVFDAAVVDGLKYLPKLKLASSFQRDNQMLGIAAHFVSSSTHAQQLAVLKTIARNVLNRTAVAHEGFDFSRALQLADISARTASRYLLHRRLYNPTDGGIQLRLTGEQVPVFDSGLTLGNETDRSGMLKANLDWRIDGQELKTLSLFAAKVAEYLESTALARVELDPLLMERDPAFMEKLEDGFHHMGMARMGRDPTDGVVDRDLKVFGTENLFVAGAATFRSAGFANPTLTALALTMRLSDAIKAGTV